MMHAENARSITIGSIEKRGGQQVLGVNSNNQPFVTTNNYGLFSFQNDNTRGFYRISVAENATLSINISDTIGIADLQKNEFNGSPNTNLLPLTIFAIDNIKTKDVFNNNTGDLATIYYINGSNQWIPLTGDGTNIAGGKFDYTYAEGNLFIVNQNSPNRYIASDGVTVTTSNSASGHMFNTPPSSLINYYKSRLYLADFIQTGVRYKTTILQSSYVMGIISLFNNDYLSATSGTTINVTDTTYFYTDSGANLYDVYRGQNFIAQITVTVINQTSIVATWSGTPDFLSSDEIWIAGTYIGKKIFRWVNNPSVSGRDVKQYNSFKLSGGENDPITMLTNIGNVMMVANKSTLSSWNDYTLENFDLNIGCVSKKGYIKAAGVLYFLDYTGIYSTTGGVPTILSNKIERYITGATRTGKETCAAGKKGLNVFFTLGDVTLYNIDGSVDKILKDVCAEYNIIQQNWYIHSNVKASEFATFIEEVDSDRLEFTDTSGNHAVKEFLSGETDDGQEIQFRIDTIALTTGVIVLSKARVVVAFEYSTVPIALLVETSRGSAIQAFINLDNETGYYPLEGKVTKGLSVIKINNKDDSRAKPPAARLVSISLRDSSKSICKISRITLIYIPTSNEIQNEE